LLHQHLTGFELDPCEVRAHGGQHLGVHLAKMGLQVVAQALAPALVIV